MINVGVEMWGMRPVVEAEIEGLFSGFWKP